jgi:hypothetical protein
MMMFTLSTLFPPDSPLLQIDDEPPPAEPSLESPVNITQPEQPTSPSIQPEEVTGMTGLRG